MLSRGWIPCNGIIGIGRGPGWERSCPRINRPGPRGSSAAASKESWFARRQTPFRGLDLVPEVRQVVVLDGGPYEPGHGPKTPSQDPSPLEVKEVKVGSPR